MKDILCILFVFCWILLGFVSGVTLHGVFCDAVHKIPMDALGIEKFQKCEINTTNCHSNWYEIVWKKEK